MVASLFLLFALADSMELETVCVSDATIGSKC